MKGHAHGPHGHSHGEPSSERPEQHYAFHPAPELGGARGLERSAGRGKILFFDCQSGISGDMTLAALVDLGVPRAVFDGVISALGLAAEVQLSVERGHAGVISATRVRVEPLGVAPERSYAGIRTLLEASALDAETLRAALSIFERLAQAEARVHGVAVSDVMFHEVGAVDSIVDIVGAAAGLSYLGAELVVSPLPLGRGYAETRHGRLPLPAPATVLCLEGVPTTGDPLDIELVTPTGAAIVASLAARFLTWPAVVPERVGWGAGTMTLPDRPNALRAVLGTPGARGSTFDVGEGTQPAQSIVLLEANVDDMTGELLGHALGCLMDAGALDAWIVPILMKKGRPAHTVSALAPVDRVGALEQVFFDETTTIGVRRCVLQRSVLPRETLEVQTRFGIIPIKQSGAPPHQHQKPEFDVCRALAEKYGVPVRLVIEEALHQLRSRR